MDDYLRNSLIFSRAADEYDEKISANKINLMIRDIEVQIIHKIIKGSDIDSVLEVGCGTGQEALRVIRGCGVRVDCIDISGGMLGFARKKMIYNGVADKFRPIMLSAGDIGAIRNKYGLIYSFNGAINTEPRIKDFISGASKILMKDGYLVFSLRNRICISDFVYSILKMKWGRIRERLGGFVDVPVSEFTVKSRYYSHGEIIRLLPGDFKVVSVHGLGTLIFPFLANSFPDYFIDNFIRNIEFKINPEFPFNVVGDEILYVLQKL